MLDAGKRKASAGTKKINNSWMQEQKKFWM
jgi:hypothetical protein